MATNEITLDLDASALEQVLNELLENLADAPLKVRELALGFIKRQPQLAVIDSGPASGAVVPLLLKPSQGLLDLVRAVRAGDLDAFVVKYSH